MSYIDRNLLSEETILFRTKKHLIIFLPALIWTIFAIYAAGYMQTQPFLRQLAWVPFGLTLFLWVYYGLEYLFF